MVRHHRRRRGMMQSELGQRVGVCAATISRWERGYETITFARRERLAEILGIDPARLTDPETYVVTSKDRRILDGYYSQPPSERAALDELMGLRGAGPEARTC
ncbi:helix-turn-helix domain-containing protein [Methylorubrum salsuginis]|nr:helix-turn-helix transcriptional regulator [Methylorubrum salsuginis]